MEDCTTQEIQDICLRTGQKDNIVSLEVKMNDLVKMQGPFPRDGEGTQQERWRLSLWGWADSGGDTYTMTRRQEIPRRHDDTP